MPGECRDNTSPDTILSSLHFIQTMYVTFTLEARIVQIHTWDMEHLSSDHKSILRLKKRSLLHFKNLGIQDIKNFKPIHKFDFFALFMATISNRELKRKTLIKRRGFTGIHVYIT